MAKHKKPKWILDSYETSLTTELAAKHARSVPAGVFCMTRSTFQDTGDLIGLDGASLIVKRPHPRRKAVWLYRGIGSYARGRPKGKIQYTPLWWGARAWLVDFALQRNLFADDPYREAVMLYRIRALDSPEGGVPDFSRMDPPAGCAMPSGAILTLSFDQHGDVPHDEDLPLAMWYPHCKGVRGGPDLVGRAKGAPWAYVLFIRFRDGVSPWEWAKRKYGEQSPRSKRRGDDPAAFESPVPL